MTNLELKVPPPLVALVAGLAMWGLSYLSPVWVMDAVVRYTLAIVLALLGISLALAGFISFRLASTTIDPMHPDRATSLVTTGIYRITRNPMYLGLLCLLLAWACYLQSAWAFMGPVFLVVWLHNLQILPEERFLKQRFGAVYLEYQHKVRRWL